MKRTLAILSALAFAFPLTVVADEPQQQQLASALLQDEIGSLPEDNTAFFTASREVKLQLDLLAALDTPFDLTETVVTVVRPNGESTPVLADENGEVIIDNVGEGPHAVVASGDGVP